MSKSALESHSRWKEEGLGGSEEEDEMGATLLFAGGMVKREESKDKDMLVGEGLEKGCRREEEYGDFRKRTGVVKGYDPGKRARNMSIGPFNSCSHFHP